MRELLHPNSLEAPADMTFDDRSRGQAMADTLVELITVSEVEVRIGVALADLHAA